MRLVSLLASATEMLAELGALDLLVGRSHECDYPPAVASLPIVSKVILAPCGFTLERTMQDLPLLQQHPVWPDLRAVREDRVFAIDGNAYLNRSGPRLVESAEILAYCIWGEHTGVKIDHSAWQHIH